MQRGAAEIWGASLAVPLQCGHVLQTSAAWPGPRLHGREAPLDSITSWDSS